MSWYGPPWDEFVGRIFVAPESGSVFPFLDSGSLQFLFLQVHFCLPFSLFWDPYNVNIIVLDGVTEFSMSILIIQYLFVSHLFSLIAFHYSVLQVTDTFSASYNLLFISPIIF